MAKSNSQPASTATTQKEHKFVEVIGVQVDSPEIEGKRAVATIVEDGHDTVSFISEWKTTSAVLELASGKWCFVRLEDNNTQVRVELTKNTLFGTPSRYAKTLNISEVDARHAHDVVVSIDPRISAAFTLGELFSDVEKRVTVRARGAEIDLKGSSGSKRALEIASSFFDFYKPMESHINGLDLSIKAAVNVGKEALNRVTDIPEECKELKQKLLDCIDCLRFDEDAKKAFELQEKEKEKETINSRTLKEMMPHIREALGLISDSYQNPKNIQKTKVSAATEKIENYRKLLSNFFDQIPKLSPQEAKSGSSG